MTTSTETKKGLNDLSFSVKLYKKEGNTSTLAYGSVVINGCFVVNNISIRKGGKTGWFVSMPSYKTGKVDENGKPIYKDHAHPITPDCRKKLYPLIEAKYTELTSEKGEDGEPEEVPF